MLYQEQLDRIQEVEMFDYYSYMNAEIRNQAFFKSSEPTTWQDAVKQKPVVDIENRLSTFISSNWLGDLSKALLYPYNQWRQAHLQAPVLMNNLPSQ